MQQDEFARDFMNSTVGQLAMSPQGQVFINETATLLQSMNVDLRSVDMLFGEGSEESKFNKTLDAVEEAVVGQDYQSTWAGLFGAFREGLSNSGYFRKGERNG